MTDERPIPRGEALLHDPALNKGTAFTSAERDALGLRGLLPPRSSTLEEQKRRVLENLRRKPDDLEKYIFLIGLQDRNETLFYRLLVDHVEEMMPLVYTPTVGEACRVYGHIFRRPRGLYVSADDRGRVADLVANWPREAGIVCVTDGERILGLGDLGAHGMGIPVGKLSLYTALAGVHPSLCLPVTLDVGTDNEELRRDPLYTGLQRPRLRGEAYFGLVDEFVEAVRSRFPRALVQWEDFATENAFALLERYRRRVSSFNDDIQGTASVVLAGLLTSESLTGRRLTEETILFLGAGAAAVGIADLVTSEMVGRGLSETEARRRVWFVDSRGLVVAGRDDLAEHKRPYAHTAEFQPDLLSAVEAIQPSALIGVSGQVGAFDRPVLSAMARIDERPVVFALSNPTANSECTAEQAYRWTEGRAVFASGSPFDPVEYSGRTHIPGQGNNAYIFPGVGLGIMVAGAREVTDEMFTAAARALASAVEPGTLATGRIYPPLTRIREVSAEIATAVARVAYEGELAARPGPADLGARVRSAMYRPQYRDFA